MMARLELKVQWSARAGHQLAQTALFNSRAVQGGRQSADVFPAAYSKPRRQQLSLQHHAAHEPVLGVVCPYVLSWLCLLSITPAQGQYSQVFCLLAVFAKCIGYSHRLVA